MLNGSSTGAIYLTFIAMVSTSGAVLVWTTAIASSIHEILRVGDTSSGQGALYRIWITGVFFAVSGLLQCHQLRVAPGACLLT